jgi:hypothetical protein
LLHVLALTFWAVRTLATMLRKWLDAIENPVAVATAIFVGRHPVLHVPTRVLGGLVLASRSGVIRHKLPWWSDRVYVAGSLPTCGRFLERSQLR